MPKFTKRHYETIASTFADLAPSSLYSRIELARILGAIAVQFARDNPLFQTDQFIRACGFDPIDVRFDGR